MVMIGMKLASPIVVKPEVEIMDRPELSESIFTPLSTDLLGDALSIIKRQRVHFVAAEPRLQFHYESRPENVGVVQLRALRSLVRSPGASLVAIWVYAAGRCRASGRENRIGVVEGIPCESRIGVGESVVHAAVEGVVVLLL